MPGLLPERVSSEILKASYVLLEKHDLLLKLGHCENAQEKEVTFQSDPFTPRFDKIRIKARFCQHACAVTGLTRLIVLDRGLARSVRSPETWKCERHSKLFCEGAFLTGACCAPISKGTPGEYWICWGVHDTHPPPSNDGEVEGGYEATPLAQIHMMLDKLHAQDALADTTSEEGWFRGGVMQRISCSMKRDTLDATRVALTAHQARAAKGNHLHFVWDVVSTEAAFDSLRYTLDAARPPLCDRPDDFFTKAYGMPRRLSFTPQQKRVPLEADMFEGIYR